jgi:hypothetical protein
MKKALRIAGGGLAVLVVLWGGFVFMFSRPYTKEVPVFSASRWTSGNRIFPTQVAVYPDRVVRYRPKLLGHEEEIIPVRQVASVKITAGLLFADVLIETTGGSQPIVCHGHWKSDAGEIQKRISAAQAILGPAPASK